MHVFKSIGKTNHLSVDDKSSPLWVHLVMVILAAYPFQREDLHSAEWKSHSAVIEEKSEQEKVRYMELEVGPGGGLSESNSYAELGDLCAEMYECTQG